MNFLLNASPRGSTQEDPTMRGQHPRKSKLLNSALLLKDQGNSATEMQGKHSSKPCAYPSGPRLLTIQYALKHDIFAPETLVSFETGDSIKEVHILSPPQDTITELSLSPHANQLAVVSCYQPRPNIGSDGELSRHGGREYRLGEVWENSFCRLTGHGMYCLLACLREDKDGQKVLGAGADNPARLLRRASGLPAYQNPAHEAPIRSDLRTPFSVGKIIFPERDYVMHINEYLMGVGTMDGSLNLIALNDKDRIWPTRTARVTHHNMAVSCFADGGALALGPIGDKVSSNSVADDESVILLSLRRVFLCLIASFLISILGPKKSFGLRYHHDPAPNNSTTTHVQTVIVLSSHPKCSTAVAGWRGR
ncbi:putative nuclear pore complex protein [Diplocarpon rosae]|nr:putative nuclear pore complex protein [Diplocarpon rosae]